ncbi:MAG: dihydropteroate synthase [Candidatus Accumulibacter sp.]|nr:dihydropteroate synthase [Accumulibacter sp.]
MNLRCGDFLLSLDRPRLMGIVNLTPDSLSGDGVAGTPAQAIALAYRQLADGADLLDLGAESSRPGAQATALDEELRRLIPVLAALRDCGVPLSVDTYKPEVMRVALDMGATMINDIYALRMPGALEAVAASDCAVCLMHMQGQPLTMQREPRYDDVVNDVLGFLTERLATAGQAGIGRDRLLIDPGFGFGKTLEHNLELFRAIEQFSRLDLPLLIGVSRKSMLGGITGRPVEQRLAASVSAALLAAQRGARILRVHDVAETRDALAIWQALDPALAENPHWTAK